MPSSPEVSKGPNKTWESGKRGSETKMVMSMAMFLFDGSLGVRSISDGDSNCKVVASL